MAFKILSTEKSTGVKRPSLSEFKTEKGALDHIELLHRLAKKSSRHKHFFLYEYEVISLSKKRLKK